MTRDPTPVGRTRRDQKAAAEPPSLPRQSALRASVRGTAREREPATLELVLKRNPVERLKREKAPLGIRDELPALIAAGYENVAEEDVVRLQWWGLYHDKPKIGTFMLRVKVPAGKLSPQQLRAIGETLEPLRPAATASSRPARPSSCTGWSSRRCPRCWSRIEAVGLTSAGGCGDTVRNITGCPVSGLAADELFDATPVVDAAAAQFYGNPEWADLPRKHKYSIAACADRCNAPEINCISLVGIVRDDGPGFARARRRRPLVGAADRERPGRLRPPTRRGRIHGAITTVWKEDLNYRVSRVKARIKFMVDDIGAEGMRASARAPARLPTARVRAARRRLAVRQPPGRPRPARSRPRLHRRAGASRSRRAATR